MRAYSVSWRRDWLLGKCHKLIHILTQFHRHLKPKIGDILLSIAPFLKVMGVIFYIFYCTHALYSYTQMYTEYITNFDNALKVLDESCKRNRAFEELVKEFEVYI